MPRLRRRRRLTTLLAILLFCPGLHASDHPTQLGLPPLQLLDERMSGSSQMGLCIAQGGDGTMFFGGGEAVVSFDGETWSRHPTQPASLAQTLGTDQQDRLWVAGSNVIGCFEREQGALGRFHSLRELLPERLRSSFTIWYMFPRAKDVIFVEESAVLRWDGASFQEWPMAGAVRPTAMRTQGGVFIHHRDTGIWRFGESRPELFLPRNRLGINSTLWMERRDDSWLLVTGNGLQLVGDTGHSAPCPAADDFITRNFLASVSHPPAGPLLIATLRGGLVALTEDWRLQPVLDSTLGAPTNAAYTSFQDRKGDLWVGFDEGVVRIGQPNVSRVLGASLGLGKRSALDMLEQDGTLTVATQDGLFSLDTKASAPRFTRLDGYDNFYLRLLSQDGRMLAVGFSAIDVLSEGAPVRLLKARSKMEDAVLSQRHPDLLYYVDGDGLFSLQVGGVRRTEGTRIATMPEAIICLLEDAEGGLWAAGESKGLTHLPPDGARPTGFGEPQRLLEDRRVRLGKAGPHLITVTPEATYRYDPARKELVEIPGLPRQQVITCSTTEQGDGAWIAYESPFPSGPKVPVIGRLRIDTAGNTAWTPCTIEGLGELKGIRSLMQDPRAQLWIGGGAGILKVDTRLLPRAPQPPQSPVLRANIADGDNLPAKGSPILVHLATTEYGHRETLRFQTRLDGSEENWSEPGNNPDLSFASLREGSYTLRARVVSDSGLCSPDQTLHFVVLPPWWRSTPALATWTLLLVAAAFVLPWGYSRYLRGQNRRLNELVRQRTLDLERSATDKVEFVRALSHELRNPIAGASLMSELLLSGVRGGRLEKQAGSLRSCISYLETLLDGALDLTQAESGRAGLRLEPFTPDGLLRDAAAIFGPLAGQKELDFILDAGPEPEQPLLGDLVQTKRILINFLSNAFKFTHQGSIRVSARLSPPDEGTRSLRLEVQDSGRGISMPIQSRLFREFIREGTRTEPGEKPGAGLGLALCRRLAVLAGGSVGFSSEEGKGSVFWAELPFIMNEAPSVATNEGPLPAADFSGLDVCLVDDDQLHLDALYATLEQFGIVPVKASSPEEAELILRTKDFDLVFLDYSLGTTTGLQLLTRLRASQALRPHTRFHLITGMLDVELAREATEAGFQGSHRKPLSSVGLFRILQQTRQGADPRKP